MIEYKIAGRERLSGILALYEQLNAILPNLTRGGRSNAFIENVITDEAYRRRGIGKKLMEMAVQYGRENNCYKVVLLSNIKRKAAHLFYESCGFDGNSKRGFEIRF